MAAISVEKDVDGFHPMNIGKLAMQGRKPLFIPCTPKGCIELLLRSGIEIKWKHAVVIGRSNVVGTPVAMLLQVLWHLMLSLVVFALYSMNLHCLSLFFRYCRHMSFALFFLCILW